MTPTNPCRQCTRPTRRAEGICPNCSERNKAAAARDILIENIEWLLDSEWPARIAERLGYPNPDALARRLERCGRQDLANRFRDHSRGTCAQCGGRTNVPAVTQCRECWRASGSPRMRQEAMG